MSEIAIRVENLSKQYKIGVKRHDRLKDFLASSLNGLFRRSRSPVSGLPSSEYIWALKDVSFEVKQGETLGIIGANGAGKSTLLKLLSRITEPTSGRAEIYGRVGSLLEVGVGFDRELTGRENIYLNGAVLGMKKAEIDWKFDEIVDFSGVEKFIDTPVKHYSSGMYVRLAFAVAAHLEPEILIVDEVLSVGDAEFQKKCLGKMGDVAKGGRTVLFVSHNMTAVTSLSTQGLLLDHGVATVLGSAGEVVKTYLESVAVGADRGKRIFQSSTDYPLVIRSICTTDDQGYPTSVTPRSRPLVIIVEGKILETIPVANEFMIGIDVKTVDDILLFRTHNIEQRASGAIPNRPGPFVLKCVLPPDLLPAGTYRLGVNAHISGKKYLQDLYPALEFDVVQDQLLGNVYAGTHGLLTPRCDWVTVNDVH